MAKGSIVSGNSWAALRSLTPARIALGRAGSALPTAELLRFGLAHARARDAVHAALDAKALCARLEALGLSPRVARSAAPDRETYLRRPDLGRRLAKDPDIAKSDHPFALVIADGLSALATDAERNCVSNIRPEGLGYEAAARRIDWLAAAGLARGMTGVGLKDESG
jgi:ethanolamine ammonia-lyase small subunit